jgi:hypothetical protein
MCTWALVQSAGRPEGIDESMLSLVPRQRGDYGYMKSKFFAEFGIPETECQITPERDPNGIPRLMFRSKDNPLIGLDVVDASALREILVKSGSINEAHEIDKLITAARRLPLRWPAREKPKSDIWKGSLAERPSEGT